MLIKVKLIIATFEKVDVGNWQQVWVCEYPILSSLLLEQCLFFLTLRKVLFIVMFCVQNVKKNIQKISSKMLRPLKTHVNENYTIVKQ